MGRIIIYKRCFSDNTIDKKWRIMKIYKYLIVVLFLLAIINSVFTQPIQDSTLDVSKPTNFYTFLDNNLEYTSTEGANIFGYRANLTFSISSKNLVLAEVPLLYNDNSKKMGIGDLRVRYFWLPYKDYSKFFGAFGPSVDVFAPTGSIENGLGTGRWVVAPGITTAFMLADWIQLFPVLSYQYVSKSMDSSIPNNLNKVSHGITFQMMTPIVISKNTFTMITPIITYADFSNDKSFAYMQEVLFSYGLKETLWINLFYRGAFKDNVHTVRAGFTMYL